MDTQKIQQLLEDLYSVDSSLKEHEAQLIPIIQEFIKNTPDTQFDANFATQLKSQLAQRIEAEKKKHEDEEEDSFIRRCVMNLRYTLAGGFVAALFIVPFMYHMMQSPYTSYTNQSVQKESVEDLSVTDREEMYKDESADIDASLPPQAFGNLEEKIGNQVRQQYSNGIVREGEAVGRGGGAISTQESRIAVNEPYEPSLLVYEYTFPEENTFQLQSKGVVYRRKAGSSQIDSGVLSEAFDVPIIDIDAFKQPQLKNINIVENTKNGWNLHYDTHNRSVSISPNWENWDQPDTQILERQNTGNERPDDASVIAIAQKQLQQFGVDMSLYGEPQVQWSISQALSSRSDAQFVPTSLPVIYPLQINGREVFEMYGSPFGLNVLVNYQNKSVSNIHNLLWYEFEQSEYDLVTDTEQVYSYLKKQGDNSYEGYTGKKEFVDVQLGQPKQVLLRNVQYQGSDFEELYFPGLAFPIESVEDGYDYYQKYVVVPLLPDLLRYKEESMARPLPLPVEPDLVPRSEVSEPQVLPLDE